MTIDPGTLAYALDQAVRAAGVPIDGVAVGDATDRSTWRPCLSPGATPAQADTAAATIAAFDVTTLAAISAQRDADAAAALKAIAATIVYIWRVTHAGVNPTGAQLQTELATWKAIFKALP